MTKTELEALIDRGDAEACIVAFEGMPEAERTKLASAAPRAASGARQRSTPAAGPAPGW